VISRLINLSLDRRSWQRIHRLRNLKRVPIYGRDNLLQAT
jgi:hypothetical protein